MKRRTVLAAGGLAVVGTGGYLYSWLSHSPTIPDGMAVETLYVTQPVFAEQQYERPGVRESESLLVRDETAAEELFVESESIQQFVTDTDFEQSYVAVVDHRRSSSWDLYLETIERVSPDELSVTAIAQNWPPGQVDDLGIHVLLLRITDEEHPVPDDITVTVTERDRPQI